VYVLPAALLTWRHPDTGVGLALGVLPATLVALPGPRRSRKLLVVVGVLCGVALFLGGALAHLPVAVGALALLLVVVGASLSTTRWPRAQLMLILAAPLTAAGLSYDDWSSSARTLGLMVCGAVYAWLVSLLWPDRPAAPTRTTALPDRRLMLGYGLRMGAAAAIAYGVASSAGLDHPGWAPAACLLVARPQRDLLELRGVGRIVAVALGALAAATIAHAAPPSGVIALSVAACIAAAAATRTSHWYVASAFTTYVVLLSLLVTHPEQAAQKVNERIGETLIGVALAFLFGWILPVLNHTSRSRTTTAT